MLVDEDLEWGFLSPKLLEESAVVIYLYAENANTTLLMAANAGAKITTAPHEMFWVDRYGTLKAALSSIRSGSDASKIGAAQLDRACAASAAERFSGAFVPSVK